MQIVGIFLLLDEGSIQLLGQSFKLNFQVQLPLSCLLLVILQDLKDLVHVSRCIPDRRQLLYIVCDITLAVLELSLNGHILSVPVAPQLIQLPSDRLNLSLHVLDFLSELDSLLLILVEEHVSIDHLIELEEITALDDSFEIKVVVDTLQREEEDLRSLKNPALLEASLGVIAFLFGREVGDIVEHLVLEGFVPRLVKSLTGLDV